ncbi:MAG: TnsA endonuclease N-terminal domain-containing protein [Rhodoferax sp.]|uniref:TnsA endonuclease N-terminal domain-containing protein n=1 Tax=Rhodoferax sp. TaxID=50421 RepID=UPI00326425A3
MLNWRFGRLHHLLSDLELVAFGFASMLPGVVDLREQFPLARDEHSPELATYQVDSSGHPVPGTLEIADALGHRHPTVRKDDAQEPWVMSTDFLLTLRNRMGRMELLAISVKSPEDLKNDRKLQLLRIEREYWRLQDVFWLLLTPALYAALVANSIRIGMPWAVGQPDVSAELVNACAAMADNARGRSARQFIDLMGARLSLDAQAAQCVMWQCIWSGQLPINLCRPLRLGEPLELMTPAEFWRQNPIASRRTAWSH